MTAEFMKLGKDLPGPSSYKLQSKPKVGMKFTRRQQLELSDAIRFKALQTPSAQHYNINMSSIEPKPRSASIAHVPKNRFVRVNLVPEKTPGPGHFETIKFYDKLANPPIRTSAFSFGKQRKLSYF